MKIQAFIFDLDGVLTDTSEFHFQAWKRLADQLWVPFSRKDNEALRGVSRLESLQTLLRDRPIDETLAESLMDCKNRYYLELLTGITPENLLPGATDLLTELRARGFRCAIASASKNAPMVLSKLGIVDMVDTVVDGNAPARSKPEPDLFLLAAERLGLPPDVCVVVEDAAAGIEAAQRAGMRAVALGPRERFTQADLILPSLEGARVDALLLALE